MKNLKTYTQLFESRQELTSKQKEFLNRHTRGKWIQNPKTGLVDVKGDFNCSERDLQSLSGVQFGHVSGSFNCARNQLVSLEGAPQSVGWNFYCSDNQLVSLEGAPQTVGSIFSCYHNQLTSLEGASQSVGGSFNCTLNQLTTLEGAPKSVGGSFYCHDNQLVSLEGSPESVGGNFSCHRNQLSSLVGAPESVGNEFWCDAFRLDAGEWNVQGWLKAAQESEEAAKLLIPLLPEQELDSWMRKHPLDLDLLNAFPEIKAGVIKRTGIRDLSKLAAARRQGMV